MSVGVERPFETVHDIEAIEISRGGRGNRRVAAALTGTADEIQRRVGADAPGIEFDPQASNRAP